MPEVVYTRIHGEVPLDRSRNRSAATLSTQLGRFFQGKTLHHTPLNYTPTIMLTNTEIEEQKVQEGPALMCQDPKLLVKATARKACVLYDRVLRRRRDIPLSNPRASYMLCYREISLCELDFTVC
jgi:hypothetical protein